MRIQGEAFFVIKKDSLRPFNVIANHLSATVLGTSFNVRAVPGEGNTQIVLVSGELLVEDTLNNNFVKLKPNEAANSAIPGQQIKKIKKDSNIATYWTKGIIYFDRTHLADVMKFLEKWYGVNITLRNLPTRPITCTAKYSNENLENVLKSLGFSLGFSYQIQGSAVEIIF